MSDKIDKIYYYRILNLVINVGRECLLLVFYKLIPRDTVANFFSSLTTQFSNLKRKRLLSDVEYQLVTASNPDPDKFDITLLILILTYVFSEKINKTPFGWNPSSMNTVLSADLMRIRSLRNEITHRGNTKMTKDEFNKQFTFVEEILIRMANSVSTDVKRVIQKKIFQIKTEEECEDRVMAAQMRTCEKLNSNPEKIQANTEEINPGVKELCHKMDNLREMDQVLVKENLDKISLEENEQKRKMSSIVPYVSEFPSLNQPIQHGITSQEVECFSSKKGESADHPQFPTLPKPNSDTALARQFNKTITVVQLIKKCCHDGRLMHLDDECITVIKPYLDEKHPFEGGFGKVYVSRNPDKNSTVIVPHLDIPVALKVVECGEKYENHLASVYNEKIAARIMHFAIAPLLAAGESVKKRTHYFLSPYIENGNLADAIQRDNETIQRKNGTIILNRKDRIRILFQIASAIDYLHTEIPGFRNAFIHKDIKSRNIVLDGCYNARLIDFGLAGELKKDGNYSTFSNAAPYGHSVLIDRQRPHWDYYLFGIVIREMLTGKEAINKLNHKLQKLTNLTLYMLKDIWFDGDSRSLNAKELDLLANRCIDCSVESSKDILYIMKKNACSDIYRWVRDISQDNTKKCDLCMVNPAAQSALALPEHSCSNHIQVCIACMRNSYLNPIRCHSCDNDVVPIIGHKWGALLIAGSFLHVEDEVNSFIQDVQDLKDIFVSEFPRYMGIRSEHVQTVTPKEAKDAMKSQIIKAFQRLTSNEDIEKLIIYFSGHHRQDKGFLLATKNENLAVIELQDMIKTCLSMKKIIVILDCCHPPSISLDCNLTFIQINACSRNQSSAAFRSGSIFTTCLIQGLRGKSVEQSCFKKADCSICEKYKNANLEFITIPNLLDYLESHLCIKPVLNMRNAVWKDFVIAYFIDVKVEYVFHLRRAPHDKKECRISPKDFNDINMLKCQLFKAFKDKMALPELNEDFADIICIIQEKRPRDEIDDMKKLSAAWNVKLELLATLREVENLLQGRIGLFLPEDIYADVLYKYFQAEQNPCILSIYPGLKSDLVLLNLSEIINAYSQLTTYDSSLEYFKEILLQVNEVICNQKDNQEAATYLKIIFPKQPYNETGEIRKDFVCLSLEQKDKKANYGSEKIQQINSLQEGPIVQ